MISYGTIHGQVHELFRMTRLNNLPTGQNLESDKARNHKKILHLSLIVQNFIPPV